MDLFSLALFYVKFLFGFCAERGLLLDHISLDNLEDFIHVEGFGKKRISTEFFGPLFMGVGLGHDDTGFFRVALFYLGEQLKAIHLRQIGLGDDNMGMAIVSDVFPGFAAVFKGCDRTVDAELKDIHGKIPCQLVLVHNHYFDIRNDSAPPE